MNKKTLIISLLILVVLLVGCQPYLDSCSEIQDAMEKDKCYHNLGKSLNDVSICDKIPNRNHSFTTLASLGTGAIPQGTVNVTVNFQTLCYYDVGIEKQDPLICDKIQKTFYRDECYGEVGVAKEDFTICDKIQEKHSKDNCYIDIAIIQGDLTVCDMFQEYTKYECIWGVAVTKKDISICDQIPESVFYRIKCYKGVAVAKEDFSICDEMQRPGDKEDCYYYVSRKIDVSN